MVYDAQQIADTNKYLLYVLASDHDFLDQLLPLEATKTIRCSALLDTQPTTNGSAPP